MTHSLLALINWPQFTCAKILTTIGLKIRDELNVADQTTVAGCVFGVFLFYFNVHKLYSHNFQSKFQIFRIPWTKNHIYSISKYDVWDFLYLIKCLIKLLQHIKLSSSQKVFFFFFSIYLNSVYWFRHWWLGLLFCCCCWGCVFFSVSLRNSTSPFCFGCQTFGWSKLCFFLFGCCVRALK